jgi:hypothetical protein
MSAKQVTARSFIDLLKGLDSGGYWSEQEGLAEEDKDGTVHIDVIVKEKEWLDGIESLLSQARQEARREGRLEGLQEMDIAFTHHQSVMAYGIGGPSGLEKLRSEYSGK